MKYPLRAGITREQFRQACERLGYEPPSEEESEKLLRAWRAVWPGAAQFFDSRRKRSA